MKNLITLIIAVLICTQLNSNAKTLSLSVNKKDHTMRNFKSSVFISRGFSDCYVTYSDIATSASITDIKFINGSTVYDFPSPVNNGTFTVPQGTYSVEVYTTGGSYDPGTHTGFNSVYYYGNGNLGVDCSGHSSVITFNMDLSSSTEAHINMDYGDCN